VQNLRAKFNPDEGFIQHARQTNLHAREWPKDDEAGPKPSPLTAEELEVVNAWAGFLAPAENIDGAIHMSR
jgi:hypothetical protein